MAWSLQPILAVVGTVESDRRSLRLRSADVSATAQLAILGLVVLFVLPDRRVDPWQALSPLQLGHFVFLVAAIGWVGYVLNRLLGQARGAGLTGAIGGLISSTAVTAAMAVEARRSAFMVAPALLGSLLACSVMQLRVFIIASLIAPALALELIALLGGMTAMTLVFAFRTWRGLRTAVVRASSAELELDHPFSLFPALKMGMLMAGVMLLSAIARSLLGDAGLFFAAVITGLVDVDAITLVTAGGAADGTVAETTAALVISVAVMSNSVVKSSIAMLSGGRQFGALLALRLLGAAAAGGTAAALVLLAR